MADKGSAGKSDPAGARQDIAPSTARTPDRVPSVAHPADIFGRAMANPGSLSPADVKRLQGTLGNRAVGRLLARLPTKNRDGSSKAVLALHKTYGNQSLQRMFLSRAKSPPPVSTTSTPASVVQRLEIDLGEETIETKKLTLKQLFALFEDPRATLLTALIREAIERKEYKPEAEAQPYLTFGYEGGPQPTTAELPKEFSREPDKILYDPEAQKSKPAFTFGGQSSGFPSTFRFGAAPKPEGSEKEGKPSVPSFGVGVSSSSGFPSTFSFGAAPKPEGSEKEGKPSVPSFGVGVSSSSGFPSTFRFGAAPKPEGSEKEKPVPATTPTFGFGASSSVGSKPGVTFGAPPKSPEGVGKAPAALFGGGGPRKKEEPELGVSGWDPKEEKNAPEFDYPGLADVNAIKDYQHHMLLLENPAYREMMEEMFRTRGPVRVITSRESPQPAGFTPATRTVHIKDIVEGSSGKIQQIGDYRRISYMVFELTNAFHKPRSEQLGEAVMVLDENTYAVAQERIEYEGIRKHHKIMSQGVSEHGWPKELDRYAGKVEGDWKTFDGYMKTQEKLGHTNIHRSNYRDKREARERQKAETSGSTSARSPEAVLAGVFDAEGVGEVLKIAQSK